MNLDELIAAMEATASAPPKAVEVPGWGTVYIKEVTVGDMEEQSDEPEDADRQTRVARATARVICDETGKRLFDPANKEHVDLISKQPWRLLRMIVDASEEGRKNG